MSEPQRIVGRLSELESVRGFLGSLSEGAGALVLFGLPGIGKTTVLNAGVGLAREESFRVLRCRPASAEASLSFTALSDLLEGVLDEALPDLPEPQREALEVAFLRRGPDGRAPDRRTVSVAVLEVIRHVAGSGPVLLAMDDIQWLDLPSARVLGFALRRLRRESVGLLAAVRSTQSAPLSGPGGLLGLDAMGDRLAAVGIPPMGVEELDLVIRGALDIPLSRPVLRTVHSVSGGNPLYALEISRAISTQGVKRASGELLPIPDHLRLLVGERLAELPEGTRHVLLVVSALAKPTMSLVSDAAGGPARSASSLARAAEAGVIEVDGSRIRFTHPLLGSIIYTDAPKAERRPLHRRLAEIVSDPEERARHLALGAEGPDAEVASALDEAARRARARGAPDSAAGLAEKARALTPAPMRDELQRRGIEAAAYHLQAGDSARARVLLEEALSDAKPGPLRAEVLCRLGELRYREDSVSAAFGFLGQARGEDSPQSRQAHIEVALSYVCGLRNEYGEAASHAGTAVKLAELASDQALLACARAQVTLIDALLGRPVDIDDLKQVDDEADVARDLPLEWRPSFVEPLLLKWSDQLVDARQRYMALHRSAMEWGEEDSLPLILYHWSELESWAGNYQVASAYGRDAEETAAQVGQQAHGAFALYARALAASYLGDTSAAREFIETGLAVAGAAENPAGRVLLLGARGFLELSLGDPAAAHGSLGPAAEAAARSGLAEPSVLRFIPDEVEALIALGESDEAARLLEPYADASRARGRVGAMAASARCRALLAAARGDLEAALSETGDALALHQRLPWPFERGRTMLVRGEILRRVKHKKAARETLDEAAQAFDELGTPLWSAKVRDELARIGGRATAPLSLTPTEERVAELVAQGHTNREVSQLLFISVSTVEANLWKIYRKLNLRSRSELTLWVTEQASASPTS